MQGALAAIFALAVLALPAPALAAKVAVSSGPAEEGDLNLASYTASPGEINRVTVTLLSGGATLRIAFRDTGAPVVPGEGCVANGPNQATCALPKGSFDTGVDVDLGDGNDSVNAGAFTAKLVSFNAYGGAGSDAITGSGGGRDALFGDEIAGRTGAPDVINGGSGGDFILPGGGADIVDGRGGRDELSLRSEIAPVVIDLSKGFAQAATGRDTLRSVEDAEGGTGSDTLVGNGAANHLQGDDGRDRLVGRDGNDRLDGNGGADSIFGGNGNDRLSGGAGADTLLGGNGADKLFGDSGRDVLSAGAGADRVVSRDKLRERVNCGPGRRDRVKADARDRVRGCETRS